MIGEIIEDNKVRASKAVQDISALRYRRAARQALKDGKLTVPSPLGIPTVRKSAESGAQITDTIRDRLVRGLRNALQEEPELAIEKMVKVVNETMSPYTKRISPTETTPAAKAIAVTEVRSAVDLAKWTYASRFAEENAMTMDIKKQWRHNDHLVKTPRRGHKLMHGVIVPFDKPFLVPTSTGTVEMLYPHDADAPADQVIGCQCSYDILVTLKEEDIRKSAAGNRRLEILRAAERDLIRILKSRTKGTTGWSPVGDPRYHKVKGADGITRYKKISDGDAKSSTPESTDISSQQSIRSKRTLPKNLSKFKDVMKSDMNNMEEYRQYKDRLEDFFESVNDVPLIVDDQVQKNPPSGRLYFMGAYLRQYKEPKGLQELQDKNKSYAQKRGHWQADFGQRMEKLFRNMDEAEEPEYYEEMVARYETKLNEINEYIEKHPVSHTITRNAFLAIIENGRSKNMWEADNSKGNSSYSMRGEWEHGNVNESDALDGFNFAELPTYGSNTDYMKNELAQYGGFTVILKDSVKDRCTFSISDSDRLFGTFRRGHADDVFKHVTGKGSWRIDNKQDRANAVSDWKEEVENRYSEAQIYGGYTTDDIDYVICNLNPDSKMFDWERDVLKNCGIPIKMKDGTLWN
jgi:hypothetical protein